MVVQDLVVGEEAVRWRCPGRVRQVRTRGPRGVALVQRRPDHVVVVDLATAEVIGVPIAGASRMGRTRVLFVPGGVWLAGAEGRTIGLWDVTTGAAIGRLPGHTGAVMDLSSVPGADGYDELLVSSAADLSVRGWDLARRQPAGPACLGHEGGLYEDETWIAAVLGVRVGGRAVAVSGGCDLTVRRWDLRTGRHLPGRWWPLLRHLPVPYEIGIACLTTVERDGRPIVLSGGTDARVLSHDFATGCDGPSLEPHDGTAGGRAVVGLAADVVDDERVRVASLDEHHTVRLWDLDTAALLAAHAAHRDVGVTLVDTAHVVLHGETESVLLRLPPVRARGT